MAYSATVNRSIVGKPIWGGRGQVGAPGPAPKTIAGHAIWGGRGIVGGPGPASTPNFTPAGPGGAGGAGGAAGGPSGPTANPMDPRITAWQNNAISGLGKTRDDALLALNSQADTSASGYGFNITKDEAGNPRFDAGNFTVNPQDPFSKMALLQQSYENQQRGTSNSYASAGQHSSGSFRNMQASNTSHNDQNRDALAKAFLDVINGIRGNRAGAEDAYTSGVNGVGSQALTMALGGTYP